MELTIYGTLRFLIMKENFRKYSYKPDSRNYY